MYTSINIDTEEATKRREALAVKLNLPITDVEFTDDDVFCAEGAEYLVLTDEEADAELIDHVREGAWAFNASFILSYCRLCYPGAEEALDASRLFATQLRHALNGEDKHLILVGHRARVSAPAIVDIARGDVAAWQAQGIRGSGYVVESLRAALWCFASTDSFEEAVLAAANLGDDADTTAAICGQLAGAYYGVQAIPEGWRERIVQAELINQLSDQLYQQALLG